MNTTFFIDAHMHPELLEKIDPAEIICDELFCCSAAPSDWDQLVSLKEKFSNLRAFLGIHPWKIDDESGKELGSLKEYLSDSEIMIGEIGLDKMCSIDFSRQEDIFLKQIKLSSELKRSFCLHSVAAWKECRELITSVLPGVPWIYHSFKGDFACLREALDLGAYIAVSTGSLKARVNQANDIIRKIPQDRLLIETDAPYSMTEDDFSTAGYSAYLSIVYKKVAEARGTEMNTLREQVLRNGEVFQN